MGKKLYRSIDMEAVTAEYLKTQKEYVEGLEALYFPNLREYSSILSSVGVCHYSVELEIGLGAGTCTIEIGSNIASVRLGSMLLAACNEKTLEQNFKGLAVAIGQLQGIVDLVKK